MTRTRSSAGSASRTHSKPKAKLHAAVKSSPTGPREARCEAVPLDGRAQRSYPNHTPAYSPKHWVRKSGRSIKGSETPHSRRLLVERIESRTWSLAAAAEAAGVSERTAYRWLARWRADGEAGLLDRSSRPRGIANRTPGGRERVIEQLRRLYMTAVENGRVPGDGALERVGGPEADRARHALAAGAPRAAEPLRASAARRARAPRQQEARPDRRGRAPHDGPPREPAQGAPRQPTRRSGGAGSLCT